MDPDELETVANYFIKEMLHASPAGLRLTKDALNHTLDMSGLESVIAMEDRNQTLCSRDPNFSEGITAFLEKRDPTFQVG